MPLTARKERATEWVGDRAPAFLEHFPQLLLAVYGWRYVTAPLLKRLLPHSYSGRTSRTARRHLNTLVALGYLKYLRLRPIDPKVYSVTAKTRRLLQRHYPKQRFLNTREEAIRLDSLSHELAVSEIQLDIHHAITGRDDLDLVSFEPHNHTAFLNFERRYFHATRQLTYQTESGRKKRLEPDLGFLVRSKGNDESYLQLNFLEMDMGNAASAKIGRKIDAYERWYEQWGRGLIAELYESHGAPTTHPSYRLLVVTRARPGHGSDQSRLHTMYNQAVLLPADSRRRLAFTTNDAIERARPGNQLLAAPIWMSPKKTAHLSKPLL